MVAPTVSNFTLWSDSTPNNTVISHSHTPGAGVEATIFVLRIQGAATFGFSSGPTFGGTSVDSVYDNDDQVIASDEQHIKVYVRFSPSATAQTFSAEVNTGWNAAMMQVFDVQDIDTTNVATAFNEITDYYTPDNVTTIDLTHAAAGSSGNTMLAIGGWRGGDQNPFSVTTGTGWTEEDDQESGTDGTNDICTSIYTKALSGTDTGLILTRNGSQSDQAAGVVLEMVAAGVGGGVTIQQTVHAIGAGVVADGSGAGSGLQSLETGVN